MNEPPTKTCDAFGREYEPPTTRTGVPSVVRSLKKSQILTSWMIGGVGIILNRDNPSYHHCGGFFLILGMTGTGH